MKLLNPNKASFGRHETFALRYFWLTKGFQAFAENNAIFKSDEATITLGVGKNMVNSIRYWLRATQLLDEQDHATELGTAIFAKNGFDPFLEDDATLWLIHWQLATNAEYSTAIYWFFNCYHKPEFNSDETANALIDFVTHKLSRKHSEKTVRQEIALILRMYCPARLRTKDIEDILDSPLTTLNLISGMDGKNYRSLATSRETLPLGVFGFAVNELFNQTNAVSIPPEILMYGEKNGVALGSIFRLTENALITRIEQLVMQYPNVFRLTETAGMHQLFRYTKPDSMTFLNQHYHGTAQL
ncbi:MAG: DUF4007 family protein [Methylococcales bacterium]|nr:DUF4007 family protein [Methylococcales bacterium]